MRIRIVLPGLLLATAPTPAAAWLPPPPPPPSGYYGPLTICRDGFAITVAADEAYQTPGMLVRSPRAGLSVESFIYDLTRDADIARQTGVVTVPGLGDLIRLAMSSRNSDWRGTGYLLKIEPPGYFRYWVIQSDGFDGTDADIARLTARISAGETAQARCAAVPPEQQPAPAREDRDVVWFQRDPKPGPATLCWQALALDIKPGERARVPWGKPATTITARIENASGTLNINGWVTPPAAGTVLNEGGFRLGWPAPSSPDQAGYGVIARPGEESKTYITGPHMTFAIAGGMGKDEAAAILNRLRARTPADRCVE